MCSRSLDRDVNVLNIVHGADSIVSISLVSEADETEATGATSITVLDNDLETMAVSKCRVQDERRPDLQLPQRHQTPRTFVGGRSRRCARQGRCHVVSTQMRKMKEELEHTQ